jgi:Domain of unknown function (DUF4338)
MDQTVKITPSLRTLHSVFLERCAQMKSRLEAEGASEITAQTIQAFRREFLEPLSSPKRNELEEELHLIATMSVIIDLLAQEWRIVSTRPELILTFSGTADAGQEKERIRRGHLIDRDSQLHEKSVIDFVKGMEQRRLTAQGWHSIFSVMRDGEDLAVRLGQISALQDGAEKTEIAESVIRPYLQFVRPAAICEQTGLRLNDIWRYFRHTWVNSYRSTPGRSMMILVRDAGAKHHPVIGIASLASSVVQSSVRDKWIGWDAEGIVSRFRKSSRRTASARWIHDRTESLIRDVYIKDLLRDGILERRDLRMPTEEVVNRLLTDSAKSIARHRLYPHSAKHKSGDSLTAAGWRERAETSLFRSKRTKQLAKLLSIRMALRTSGLRTHMSAEDWTAVFESSSFRTAISQLIRFVKAERVGINMMDIVVCGAVAPYNAILGGKLICLLLCSPEVEKEFAERYRDHTSLIASAMRGAPVKRKAQLALLCTTSLYGSALSQYSRVQVPAIEVGGAAHEKVQFEALGRSEGFGSFQFSKETLRLLGMVLGRAKQARKVNSIFGEGVNPLMRKIRDAMSMLGLPAEILLNHGNKRVVYGIALARNYKDFLSGFTDTPQFILPQTKGHHRTELLAKFWTSRWMLKRLEKPGVLEQVSSHGLTYPIRHGAQVLLPEVETEMNALL